MAEIRTRAEQAQPTPPVLFVDVYLIFERHPDSTDGWVVLFETKVNALPLPEYEATRFARQLCDSNDAAVGYRIVDCKVTEGMDFNVGDEADEAPLNTKKRNRAAHSVEGCNHA